MESTDYRLNNGNLPVTEKMKEEFEENGYVIVREVLDTEEVEKVFKVWQTADFRKHEYGRDDAEGKQAKLIVWNTPGNDVTGLVARCEKVVNTCEELIGGEIYHYHTKLNTKEPHVGGTFEWHQDYGYWYEFGCLFPDMMTVFIALDKCSKDNGCLQVLKGSHKCGRIAHGISGDQVGADVERVGEIEKRLGKVFVELSPGDALFFHCNLLHTSGANTTADWRRALLVTYNRASNDPLKPVVKYSGYTPIQKVSNDSVRKCENYTDFTGKEFMIKAPYRGSNYFQEQQKNNEL